MLKLRVLTAVVVLPLFLAAMFLLPSLWWSIGLVIPLLVAAHEWSRLATFNLGWELLLLVILLAGCGLLWHYGDLGDARTGGVPLAITRVIYVLSALFWCIVAPCWLRLKVVVRSPVVHVVVGVVALLPAWLALVQLQSNAIMLVALLAVVWIADSAAYFAGRAVGRIKLAADISPGKTWEGVGGALITVTVYALVLHFWMFLDLATFFVIAAFLGMTCLGIVGDLFESWLKRNAGVKDSGRIFPGHGGMLDRIDAVIAALPAGALIFF